MSNIVRLPPITSTGTLSTNLNHKIVSPKKPNTKYLAPITQKKNPYAWDSVWNVVWDDSKNKWFYYNTKTWQSQWEEPEFKDGLLIGWSAKWDDTYNEWYYEHDESGESQWDVPKKILIGEWEKIWCNINKSWYYYNHKTDESKWTLDIECTICLENIDDDSKTLPCNHKFHAECIDSWQKINNTCPCCRA